MRKERKKTMRIGKICLLIVILIISVYCFGKFADIQNMERFSANHVYLEEVKDELSFGVYADKDWDIFFGSYHKEHLTGDMLARLLTELGVAEYIDISKIEHKKDVNREDWNLVYNQILDLLDMERNVALETILILGVKESENNNILITNHGEYGTALPASYFQEWESYAVYVLDGQCIGVSNVTEEEVYINNAYLTEYENGVVHFLFQGVLYEKEIGVLGESVQAGVVDLVCEKGDIISLRMKQEIISGELLSYDDTAIEIAGYGRVAHPEELPVYQTYGEIVQKAVSDVILGNMEVEYVTGDGQSCAILIRQAADIQDIRVLLLSEDGTNFRETVYLKSDVETVLQCAEEELHVAAGTVIGAETYLSEEREETLVIEPINSEGSITICDANGNAISNGYPGIIEVRRYEEGYTIVNQVPFETYLCAVVPSEMPSSYEPEALKAQAVCARSYAYIQLMRADLAAYGAHISDSTSYQVYNKIPATEESRTAVYETAGKMLLYEGQPVEAYYFSTSMGYTATAEVWNVADMSAYGYLKSVCLNTDAQELDLSDEETFCTYISQGATGYDSDVKYYRWFAQADYHDKTDTINQILIKRHGIAKQNIIFYKSDGVTEITSVDADALDKLGKITEISVEERSKAGAILTLKIQYKKGFALVYSEYNIRQVLGACVEKLVYADSSDSTSVTMLPSAFCAITEAEDGTILLQGGGYGHGLGMSQNGANGMAKAGMTYEEILKFYYKDVEIGTIQ